MISYEKVQKALYRIKKAHEIHGDSIFLGHSGGKDSCVINHLAQRVIPNYKIVHNVKPILGTSGDPVGALTEMYPSTLEFLYSNVSKQHPVEFLHSSQMPDYIKRNGLTCQIDGARIEEHDRPGKSSNIIRNGESVNRKEMTEYEPNGIFGLAICYPILDWSSQDIFDYLDDNNLPFSKEYIESGEYEQFRRVTK